MVPSRIAGRSSIQPQMSCRVDASLWGTTLIWAVRVVSATDACTLSGPTWWLVSSVRTCGSMDALSTIRTLAGWGMNDVHRLESRVSAASWRRYSVSGMLEGGSTGELYPRRPAPSITMGSSSGTARTGPSMWSAIAVMQLEMAPIENDAPSISLSISRMSSSVLWARSKACRVARRRGPKDVPEMVSVCGAVRAPHPGHLPIRITYIVRTVLRRASARSPTILRTVRAIFRSALPQSPHSSGRNSTVRSAGPLRADPRWPGWAPSFLFLIASGSPPPLAASNLAEARR